MMRKLNDRIKSYSSNRKIQISVGDARNLNIKSSSIDSVICINGLSHIPNYKNVLREIYRILKPGGKLIFNFPNYFSCYLPAALFINLKNKSLMKNVFTKWYNYYYVINDLRNMCFEIKKIKGQLHIPMGMPEMFIDVLNYIDDNYIRNKFFQIAPIIFVKAIKR